MYLSIRIFDVKYYKIVDKRGRSAQNEVGYINSSRLVCYPQQSSVGEREYQGQLEQPPHNKRHLSESETNAPRPTKPVGVELETKVPCPCHTKKFPQYN
jgi:hypothetical protein